MLKNQKYRNCSSISVPELALGSALPFFLPPFLFSVLLVTLSHTSLHHKESIVIVNPSSSQFNRPQKSSIPLLVRLFWKKRQGVGQVNKIIVVNGGIAMTN